MKHPNDDKLEAMAKRLEASCACSIDSTPCLAEEDCRMDLEAAAMLRACKGRVSVDELAQIIRVVDGSNTLGAGALAEAILAAIDPAPDQDERARKAGYRYAEAPKKGPRHD